MIYVNVRANRSVQHYHVKALSLNIQKCAWHNSVTSHGSGAQQLTWKHSGVAQQQTEVLGRSPNNRETHNKERRAWSQLELCGGLSTQDISSRISRSKCNRRNCYSAQAEAETTNIRWQIGNIRWMEIQVHSIHGHTRPNIPNTYGESWASNSYTSRFRSQCSSQQYTRRRTLDTDFDTPQIHPHQHHYHSISSNSDQTTSAMGLEVYKQLCLRFSTPLGTRSIGYLTKLLKPTFDHNNFQESFSDWEFELQRYEADNATRLPDQVKIAVLMNETRGPLQQHLHLNAGTAPTYAAIRATIMEHYRTTMAFTRLQQHTSAVSSHLGGGTAPMDIGATYKGKGKGKFR